MADAAAHPEEGRERVSSDIDAPTTSPLPDGTPSQQESIEPSRAASLDEEAQVACAEVVSPRTAKLTIPSSSSAELPPLPPNSHSPDSPTTSLITSLRAEIALLTDASTQLNTKLVASVSRVGDLEDALDTASRTRTEQDALVAQLEAQKAQWEESMNTGLLVERGAIKEEMQRLVDGLVEEERRRGSAEEGRQRVEREVDDLSASLFEQANTMVAAERLQRVQAESRLKAAEDNLSVAEQAVQSMQQHLQSLPSLLLPAPELSNASTLARRRHLAGTLPHSEFLAFVHHLRMSKPQHAVNLAMLPPPLVSALLAQPFLARTIAEDHDPTLRLDSAPDLSWLSRRSANTAILSGELAIEPVSAATLLGSAQYASATGEMTCSMCGRAVFAHARAVATPTTGTLPPPVHGSAKTGGLSPSASTNRFSLKPFFNSPTASATPRASPGASSPMASPSVTGSSIPPVYVFRIGTAAATASGTEKDTRMYPLCHSGWCLGRLRATCELWRFVRSGMIDVIWKGEDGWVPPLPAQRKSMPALPPRRRSNSKTVNAGAGNGTDSEADTETKIKRASDTSALGLSSVPPADRPELPARKRSGWGLGFKFGSRNSSSADVAKADSSASEKEQESPLADKAELGEKMEVEVREVNDNGEEKVTEGQAVASSGEVVPADKDQVDGEAAAEPTAQPTDRLSAPDGEKSGAASPAISAASDLEQGFSTPKGQSPGAGQVELPAIESEEAQAAEEPAADAAPTEAPANPEEKVTDENAVDLTSPRTSADIGRRPVPPTPVTAGESSSTIAPPPIPRRAPNRTSVDLTNGLQPAEAQPPAVATIVEGEAIADANGDAEPAPAASDAPHTPQPDTDPSEMVTPRPAGEADATRSPAPALPPRNHARTSSSMAAPQPSKYVEGDSWEAKTWREVVRLKEEMWMARLGVVAGDD